MLYLHKELHGLPKFMFNLRFKKRRNTGADILYRNGLYALTGEVAFFCQIPLIHKYEFLNVKKSTSRIYIHDPLHAT